MKQEAYVPSKVDGVKLHILWMEPEGEPKGILQFCHGMCEHKERYLDVMEVFCKKGYITVIHDHRGHGRSVSDLNLLGYFYDQTGMAMVEDTYMVTEWMKHRYPGMPVHLFGHSMGSLVVRCYAKKYDDAIASLMVCGSPSKNPFVKVAIMMAKLACIKDGQYKEGTLFQKMAVSVFDKENPEEINGWISYNKENIKKYNEHPLDGFVFTNNGFLNLFYLMKETYDKKHWEMKNKELPILFLAGVDDPCIVSKKKFKEAILFMKHVGYTNVYAKLFEGRKHEILNEAHPEEVYGVMQRFIVDDRKNYSRTPRRT